jgi:L-lactate dehydrogenase complex protein LldG
MSASERAKARESVAKNDDARSQVFASMRKALGSARGADAMAEVQARLEKSAPTLIPAHADRDADGRLKRFIAQAKSVQTDVERIDAYADLPEAVTAYLRRHNLPMRLVMAADERLDEADWTSGLLETRTGGPAPDDPIGLTTAFAGIAETGTLMLASAPDHPTMLAFLPETAIVVLPSDRVARAYEDVMHAFRARSQGLPRSINFVTGPSRSGDIEQTLQLGAHGPKRLLILLVDQPSAEGAIPDIDVPASPR